MATLIITLILAGIIAGLIQYFVDFKGLPIFQPSQINKESLQVNPNPDFWARLLRFIKRNWQLFGYIVIGIAGAFLVPVIHKLVNLPGIDDYLTCLTNPDNAICSMNDWNTLIILGYGIVSGYSSVRIIRSFGSSLIGNVTKRLQEQQQSLEEAQKQIDELKVKLAKVPVHPPKPEAFEIERQPAGEYFNETQNEVSKRSYYVGVDMDDESSLFDNLNKLLSKTHTAKLGYKPALQLYPVVDRYPDGLLRSIYSGQSFDLETLLEMDAQVDKARAEAAERIAVMESSPAEYESAMEALESALPYNCEHVVPQSWFRKKEPMRGDLHHLFTCEMRCNSFRSNNKYFDFPDYGEELAEVVRDTCGKLENESFEPERNRGIVARAVLYFLVRYPSAVTTGMGYNAKDIPMLLKWHKEEPVTLYELHRNETIYKVQGNRNPFIDFPKLAGKTVFRTDPDSPELESSEAASPNTGDDAAATTEMIELTPGKCDENQTPKPWKVWRPAESLKVLRSQINLLAPSRNKASDGMIGDLAHQSRNSDHNPWVWDKATNKGIVTALDITHDPGGKCDCNSLAKSLETYKDPRIKYVIWNRQIMNSSSINGSAPWAWRQYNGSNPHSKHIHISVKCSKDLCDALGEWSIKIVPE